MKILTFAVALSALLSGCMTTRPNTAPSERISAGNALTLAAGTAGGALIGNAVGGKKGAVIGAGVGMAATVIGTNVLGSRRDAEIEEAKEEARREERIKVMNAYWKEKSIDAQRTRDDSNGNAEKKPSKTTEYPAGVYDGVDYAARSEASPTTP